MESNAQSNAQPTQATSTHIANTLFLPFSDIYFEDRPELPSRLC